MTELSDEVRASFESARPDDSDAPVKIVRQSEEEMAPAFNAMREFYSERLVVACRRGYRQYAGSAMSDQGDVLLEETTKQMLPALIQLSLCAFCDGVMIGQRDNVVVQMSFHWNQPEHCYHEDSFRDDSTTMAAGFSDDSDVLEYLAEYLRGAVAHMAHACGFAHATVDARKIWDIWMLSGTAAISASYIAGHKMGCGWRERDVLDGIELASEEDSDGVVE